MEKVLYLREKNNGVLEERDMRYVKRELKKHKIVTPEKVNRALNNLLVQPPIRMQIDTAKKVYRDARRIMEELSSGGTSGFGLRPRNDFLER